MHGFPLNLWPTWLLPDDQPADWYQWVLVAAGHSMLGLIAFSLSGRAWGRSAAWALCMIVYVSIEVLQLLLGGTVTDGLTDALFVVGGMALADEATKREPYGFLAVTVMMAFATALGVGLRL